MIQKERVIFLTLLKQVVQGFALGAVAATVLSCGDIKLGSSSLNEKAPNGTLLVQGNFTSLNGKTVTGIASVYDMGSGNYIAYLNGLSAPSESGLYVVVIAGGVQVASLSLRSSSGSQNYSFSASSPGTFNQVKIFSSPSNMDYGAAVLN